MDIRLEHPEFRASVADLEHACDLIATARARASAHVGSLLDESWSGRAAASFADAWEDWLAASDVVVRSLSSLAEVLGDVHGVITAVDTCNASALDRVAGRLG